MKTKSGFKYQIQLKGDSVPIYVFFKSFNNKVVKCWVKDGLTGTIYHGRAECNWKDGDTFSEKEGMGLALIRALEKKVKNSERNLAIVKQVHKEVALYGSNGIINKFRNMVSKGKLSCNKQKRL